MGYGGTAYGAAMVYSPETTAVTPTAASNSGGWKFPTPRRRTAEDIQRERIALGILPPEVVRAVEKAARKSIKTAAYKAENVSYAELPPATVDALIASVGPVTGLGRDLQIWLAIDAANRAQAMKAEVLRRHIAWQDEYEMALQLEIERIVQERQDHDDAQVLALMFQRFIH